MINNFYNNIKMENTTIYLILIGTGSKPLARYSPLVGEFIDICENQLKHCKRNKCVTKTNKNYKLYYLNKNDITYMIITSVLYPFPAAISLLESMEKEFGPLLVKKDLKAIDNYGLDKELKDKLKMKFEYYLENPDTVDEKLNDLKKDLKNKYNQDMKIAIDALHERAEDSILRRNESLRVNAFKFKKMSSPVISLECKMKIWYTIIIVGIVACIAIIIVLFVC